MRTRTLTEWVVLGLLAEQPRHGFAIARLLERGSDVGHVWSASRPLTYRAIDQLLRDGLVEPVRTEAGVGPPRTILRPTPGGRRALQRWLATPVRHLRDVRAELLVKLVLLERRGRDVAPLLTRQREEFAPLLTEVRARPVTGSADRWRLAQADAVDGFLAAATPTGAARRG